MNYFDSIYFIINTILNQSKDNFALEDLNLEDDDNEYAGAINDQFRKDIASWILFDSAEDHKKSESFIRTMSPELFDKEFGDDFYICLFTSYASFFKLLKIEENYAYVRDLILDKNIKIFNSQNLINKEADYYFIRIGSYNDEDFLMHIYSTYDEEFSNYFMNIFWGFLLDNHIIKNKKVVSKEFLKEYLSNILLMYRSVVNNYLYEKQEEYEKDMLDDFYKSVFSKDDLKYFNKFKGKLMSTDRFKDFTDEKISYYLSLLFTSYLDKNNINFSSYNKLNFEKIYENMAKNGYFVTTNELNDSLILFSNYYTFLKTAKKVNLSKLLKSLDRAMNNIFLYQNLLSRSLNGFFVDESLLNIIMEEEEPDSKFLADYENFLDYGQFSHLFLVKNGEISPAIVKDIAEELLLRPTKDVKNLRQYHFPQILIFIQFSKLKNILIYNDDEVWGTKEYEISEGIEKYMSLDIHEKYSLWLSTLLRADFYEDILTEDKIKKIKDFLVDLLIAIDKKNLPKDYKIPREMEPYIDILVDLNIIEINSSIKFTSIGKKIFKYYNKMGTEKNLISIDFRKNNI